MELEPIAIIGIGCRFPKADGPEAFWTLLQDGVDAIGEIPADRFDVSALYDPRPGTPGRMMTRWGGFLEGIDLFDAAFFSMSPREAERLDPQQRLLLETAWEALEAAGQVRERLVGSQTGVFVGMWLNEYEARMFRDPGRIDFYMTTGSGRYSASGRLSHVFGFSGPSITLDCACSSSLVAVHLACQSLRTGETNLALAGGANVILEPCISIAYSQSRMMAPDGRCKFGDARANGYVRSDGAAVVVLKRLADALRDGDPIEALILGSAVNNDGQTSGSFGTPGRAGQEDLLRKACRRAGVNPADVQYVEAHGTGTRAGDPVEIQALAAVLGEGRPSDRPLVVGSAKTNIGHTEGAAGLAGLIKTVLALKHRTIPRNLHLETPNPDIPWAELPILIPKEPFPLPPGNGPALAGVSSFGIAGTNAHVVLQEAPPQEGGAAPDASPRARLLPLSAHSPEALKALARDYRDFLSSDGEGPSLDGICYTAAARRTHQEHRLAVVGEDRAAMVGCLEGYLQDEARPGLVSGRQDPERSGRVVFVFPGQGSQWLGMGRQLAERERVFRESLEACDAAIRIEAGWSVLDELAADDARSRLDQIDIVQPTLFSIQVSLAAQWRSWGIEPDAVVGHSMGEVAAAHVAGALSLEDAVRVICRRSRLLLRTRGQGAMAVVELSMQQAQEALAGYEDRLSVAVSNSSRSTVLSGDPAALNELIAALERKEVFCRRVKVDVASHSSQMDPLRADLLAALQGMAPQSGAVPFFSTVEAKVVDGAELRPEYWVRNLRQPVLFSTAVQRLLETGHDAFIEVSPHPILLPALQQELQHLGREAAVVPSLKREEPEQATLLESLGGLYARGQRIEWTKLHPKGGRVVALPSYPWQRKRYWIEAGTSSGMAWSGLGPAKDASGEGRPQHYRVDWRQRDLSGPAAIRQDSGRWLILADEGGVGRALAALLEERGDSVTLVRAGEPTAADLEALVHEVVHSGSGSWSGIVHLWGLDASGPGEETAESLDRAVDRGCASTGQLCRALARLEGTLPRLWLVTRGTQPVGTMGRFTLGASPLWGLGRVAALERPEVWGGLVDLDPAAPSDETAALCAQLCATDDEDQVAFRDGGRFVPRLVPVEEDGRLASPAPVCRPDGAYLITGGLGGLGLQVARWLVEQGARDVVLVGRTGLPARAGWDAVAPDSPAGKRIAAVRALEARGARVSVAAADVADLDAMTALFDTFGRTRPPLRGVVHAAGVLSTALLADLDPESLQAVLRPKVRGGWVLHHLTQSQPIDFLVLFSSGASVWGSRGLSHYAAANHFLDTLAHARRASGLPATSVNWGWWSGGGMETEEIGTFFRQVGLAAMSSQQALSALGRLLREGAVQQTVAAVDWRIFKPIYEAKRRRPLFEEIRIAPPTEVPVTEAAPPVESFLDRLKALPAPERRERLHRQVTEEVARALGFDSPDEVDPRQGFFKLGMDSILTVRLRNRLQTALGQPLPSTIAFEYPTVEALSEYLLRLALPAGPACTAVPPSAETGRAPVSTLRDDLSEEELTALLAEKLRTKP